MSVPTRSTYGVTGERRETVTPITLTLRALPYRLDRREVGCTEKGDGHGFLTSHPWREPAG